ncbi:MAG: AmmeMemoRadiSam system protein B [Candidatus Margulisiibacteriota bacterium]
MILLVVRASAESSVVAGIAPHHLPLVASMLEEFYENIGQAETFVVMGPRHDDRIKGRIITTSVGDNANSNLTNQLVASGLVVDEANGFKGEHSIFAQAQCIRRVYPRAKIVPILFRSNVNGEETGKLAELLYCLGKGKNIVVIASVDLAHYLPLAGIIEKDIRTIKKLEAMRIDEIEYGDVDSRPAVLTLLKYARLAGVNTGKLVRYSNTVEITQQRKGSYTGYATMVFSGNLRCEIMVVGDIMLSRYVGKGMARRNNWEWPFLKIRGYLNKADLLIGNLEGPISLLGRPQEKPYIFRADPRSIKGLVNSGFKVLSLANNHMGDYGVVAYRDTQELLRENGINWVGYDLDGKEFIFKCLKIKGEKIAIGAYSEMLNVPVYNRKKTKEAFFETISNLKNDGYVVIVMVHFGEEYAPAFNQHQQELAKALIEAGAKVVVGSHPHVVQGVERYKDGYIAYSLGNFVFDQNHSAATQSGKILKLIIENGELAKVLTDETRINKSFQVELFKQNRI